MTFDQKEYEKLEQQLKELKASQEAMKKTAGADFEKYQSLKNAERDKLKNVATELYKNLGTKKFTDEQILKIAGRLRFLATPKTE